MSDENLEYMQPDPIWDYYPLWHSLQHVKAKIEAALKVMNEYEYLDSEADQEIQSLLAPASNKLIEIINELPA